MNYWSPTTYLKPHNYDMLFADGGSIENVPLLSFLQRKTKKIILFLNLADPLQTSTKWNVTKDYLREKQISDAIPAYFGIFIKQDSETLRRSYDYSKNHVFNKENYFQLILLLQKAQKEGKGLIATMNLTTIKNDYWGIPQGFRAQVTFVYLGRLSQWEEKLSPEMKKLIVPTGFNSDLGNDIKCGPFANFPHYTTLAGGINYERANLLGNMVGWSILENKELFQSICS